MVYNPIKVKNSKRNIFGDVKQILVIWPLGTNQGQVTYWSFLPSREAASCSKRIWSSITDMLTGFPIHLQWAGSAFCPLMTTAIKFWLFVYVNCLKMYSYLFPCLLHLSACPEELDVNHCSLLIMFLFLLLGHVCSHFHHGPESSPCLLGISFLLASPVF